MSRTEALGFLAGAMVAGYSVVALLFARFWRKTRDRLFLIFSAAFCLLALQRFMLSMTAEAREGQLAFYLVRLLAYLLILWAIIDKNRADTR
ncbi:MAG: DUF5985 family protein [Thermodesulfobacteriota bacterium]